MRVFVGLAVPDIEQGKLDSLLEGSDMTGLHHPNDRHMTLFFIGNIEQSEVDSMIKAIDILNLGGPISWTADRLGVFPDSKHPKVWAIEGLSTGRLDHLRTVLSEQTNLGCLVEKRSYRPHVSLSRSPSPGTIDRAIRMNLVFSRLAVFKSSGANDKKGRYQEIAGWELE